jgi:hypothetical protein
MAVKFRCVWKTDEQLALQGREAIRKRLQPAAAIEMISSGMRSKCMRMQTKPSRNQNCYLYASYDGAAASTLAALLQVSYQSNIMTLSTCIVPCPTN